MAAEYEENVYEEDQVDDVEPLEDDEELDELDDEDGMVEEEAQPFVPEYEELTEEQLDNVADTAIDVLRMILKHFGAEDAEIDEYEGDEGEILLDVVGADLAILIGRHGRTLDSLQFLVSSIVNRRLGFRYPVVVDVEGYKYRRRQKLEQLARSAASRAVRQHSPVRLHPMTPYERRIVHIALRDDSRVNTISEGEDPRRMVVVHPNKL